MRDGWWLTRQLRQQSQQSLNHRPFATVLLSSTNVQMATSDICSVTCRESKTRRGIATSSPTLGEQASTKRSESCGRSTRQDSDEMAKIAFISRLLRVWLHKSFACSSEQENTSEHSSPKSVRSLTRRHSLINQAELVLDAHPHRINLNLMLKGSIFTA